MSLDEGRGAAYAFRELMKRAADEIEAGNGELKPARVLFRRPNPKKTYIGPFAAKLLRFGRRA